MAVAAVPPGSAPDAAQGLAHATGDTLSWPSAFWALIGIATTTMTQPSGMVLGEPSRMNFWLRSSPIICVANALGSLVALALGTRATAFSCALRAIKNSRFAEIDDSASASSYQTFCSNTVVRVILFVISLAQAIKIYATSGILVVQCLASAYLAAFVVDEAVLLAAWCFLPEDTARADREVRVAVRTPYIAADWRPGAPEPNTRIEEDVLAAMWRTSPIASSLLGVDPDKVPGRSVLASQVVPRTHEKARRFRMGGVRLVLYWSSTLAYCFVTSKTLAFQTTAQTSMFMVSAFAFTIVLLSLATSRSGLDYPLAGKESSAYLVWMTSLISNFILTYGYVDGLDTTTLILSGVVFNAIPSAAIAHNQGVTPLLYGWGSLILNVLALGLYFSTAYNKSVTWRPMWTNYLG